jgi:hypothetical protein
MQANGTWRNTNGRADGWVLAFGGNPDLGIVLSGTSGEYASTPDSAAASIVGDIDIRIRVKMPDWTPAAFSALISKGSAGQYSYQLGINTNGTLLFGYSFNGVAYSFLASTVAPTVTNGAELWLRVTMDVADGSGKYVRTFYTSVDGVDWTQLGTASTLAGTASIYNGTAALEIGGELSGTVNRLSGTVYYAEVRNGIGGTVAVKFDPTTDGTLGGTSFVSSTGETWTLNGGIELQYA